MSGDEHLRRGSLELAVVGAGPAGSAAAIAAARAGARVALIDRARFPRDKCCGDGLTTAALRQLERLGLDPGGLESFLPVDEVLVRSASGGLVTLPLGDDETPGRGGIAAAVCRRVELDGALVELARGAGAEVIEGDAVVGVAERPDGVELTLASGRCVGADAVIAADGAWSAVRRAVAPGGARGEPQHWHAYRTYVAGVSSAAQRQLLVAFMEELLPGYAWSFPLAGGHANVGVCLARETRRAGSELAALCQATLESPFLTSFLGPAARRVGPLRSWPIPAPIGSLALSALCGRVLFAGDAARAADPFSGEGIAQALESGVAAALSLTANRDPETAARRYEEEIGAGLGPDHAVAAACNRLVRRPLTNRAVVQLADRSEHIARGLGRWLFEAYPRSLPLTPARWHRGVLSEPLPYARSDRDESSKAGPAARS
jgi:geranylgeranyl reductase family protein